MTQHTNAQGQPIGAPLQDWAGRPPIPRTPMRGRTCDVVPLAVSHAPALHAAFDADTTGRLWTYMPTGPFADAKDYTGWVATARKSKDPLFFTVIDKASGAPVGVASFLRIDPANGVAEVGFITFAPALQRTVMATEAMFLMMKRVFDELGYRRYEWKCDALNARQKRRRPGWGLPMMARSSKPSFIKDAIGTPRGFPSLMGIGQRSKRVLRRG